MDPAHASVMAGSGGGFTGRFLKSGWATFLEILGPRGASFFHATTIAVGPRGAEGRQ
jgi:hypothetical protein